MQDTYPLRSPPLSPLFRDLHPPRSLFFSAYKHSVLPRALLPTTHLLPPSVKPPPAADGHSAPLLSHLSPTALPTASGLCLHCFAHGAGKSPSSPPNGSLTLVDISGFCLPSPDEFSPEPGSSHPLSSSPLPLFPAVIFSLH